MSQAGDEALVRELRLVRQTMRGNILRVVASYRCPSDVCPVGLVKLFVAEEPGRKAFQPPNRCSRCGVAMVYVGLQVG